MRKPPITVHISELDEIGMEVKPIQAVQEIIQSPHRDDHYLFILQQKGVFAWELDFEETILRGASVAFIAPGQVHKYISKKDSTGWFLFVDPGLVSTQYREIFDTYRHMDQLVAIQPKEHVFELMPVLEDMLLPHEKNALKKTVLLSLLETIIGMIASGIIQSRDSLHLVGSRKYHLVTQFRQSVKQNYKERKQVRDYASLLNITPLYLNEVVKEITGFPSSYWIHQEIILEAKRLLYYTNLDVQQIAYALGYEDPAYFSRFFKKITGAGASAFRKTNHGLSNNSH